ncbi:hypothetical protein Cni_G06502 [Canna indica]|uniref:Protein kinase domain-containing protein n=1 Tax=Canna indica TaxID=4628 RepID=A0AAQ3Q6L6_9LILI|nr:hypothetical protein Cni_G06502 [Canna indica]
MALRPTAIYNADEQGILEEISNAKEASTFVLGKSGIGIVYKVVLDDGLTLAVRRLGEGGSQRFKEFQTEVESIGKVRHSNIVTLKAYYWLIDEKLFIYDYIAYGNLATAIHVGLRGCYVALGPTLARSFPANVVAIVTWELTAKFLGIRKGSLIPPSAS